MKIEFDDSAPPLSNSDEQAVRDRSLALLEASTEWFLSEYTGRFRNILNADSAATLFADYNHNPARYRVAIHPAAQWIRDELFRGALARPTQVNDRVVFTAGGNAAGKSTAVALSGAVDHDTAAVLDSTLSNPFHAGKLIRDARETGRNITILYINRPVDEALLGMLDRAGAQGRVVTLNQLIRSQQNAAETVLKLWLEFREDPAFTFRFFFNSTRETREGRVALAMPANYTESREALDEILDTRYRAGRIAEALYRRVKGSQTPGG